MLNGRDVGDECKQMKDLGPFRLESYNVMFHSKDACSKNGLRTKKSDLETIFFLCPSVKRDVGHIPL